GDAAGDGLDDGPQGHVALPVGEEGDLTAGSQGAQSVHSSAHEVFDVAGERGGVDVARRVQGRADGRNDAAEGWGRGHGCAPGGRARGGGSGGPPGVGARRPGTGLRRGDGERRVTVGVLPAADRVLGGGLHAARRRAGGDRDGDAHVGALAGVEGGHGDLGGAPAGRQGEGDRAAGEGDVVLADDAHGDGGGPPGGQRGGRGDGDRRADPAEPVEVEGRV